MNKVILIGNLGRDPELKYTASGSPVCTLSVATSEKWTDKGGEKQEKTEWHTVTVWGKQAESCTQYLVKGKKVCVEGRIETRSWEKDGEKKYKTEIAASHVEFLEFKSERSEPANSFTNDSPAPANTAQDEELPF